ncbi:MAG: hypothetical protein NTY04_01990 [Candidatus Staskawiczbacteria bacterium]|nr:hypothetical protein [Candidatus Staskawiczbacteria bacterium]
MQIIDKYGYLDGAIDYIEKHIVSGRGLQKIAKKARINEDLLKNLSLLLKGFSEQKFISVLQGKIEERRIFKEESEIEISGVDVRLDQEKNNAFIYINITYDIADDGEQEDKAKIEIKIYSKNNIK